MVYYFKVCKRKLWYFCNEIQMEQNSENVKIGKALDEGAYARKEKHLNIDNVMNIDFIESKKVIHEIKKSRKVEDASVAQIKYYLYYLQKKGLKGITGKIDYPLLRKSIDIELLDEDIVEMEQILIEITEIMKADVPPVLTKMPICHKCAYYELCYI